MLPTYPELELGGPRQYAGGFEQVIAVRVQLG